MRFLKPRWARDDTALIDSAHLSDPCSEVGERVHRLLIEIVGEQFECARSACGDVIFDTVVKQQPVRLVIERFGQTAAVFGLNRIGGRVDDMDSATEWVAERNTRIRMGRYALFGSGDVVFTHALFEDGVTRESLRELLLLLAFETKSYPDLATATGALSAFDIRVLDRAANEEDE